MSTTSSGGRTTETRIFALRHNTSLAPVKIKVTWQHHDPTGTAQGAAKMLPKPRDLGPAELEEYRIRYGDSVAGWSESMMGQQVGNGECWTLANDALKAVGDDCRARGIEPPMTSQSYIHGFLVFSYYPPSPPTPPGGVTASMVARGDIIQFLSCIFEKRGGGKGYCGMPDHTAVVTGVGRDGVIDAVHQNTGGVKKVCRAQFNFGELTSGEVRIFRPVGESWVGGLETVW
jgi:hypothetical protein